MVGREAANEDFSRRRKAVSAETAAVWKAAPAVERGTVSSGRRKPWCSKCRRMRLGENGKVVGLEASPKTVFVAECRVGWGRFGSLKAVLRRAFAFQVAEGRVLRGKPAKARKVRD